MKKTLVVGLGQSGQSVLRYFSSKETACIAFDTRPLDALPCDLAADYPQTAFYYQSLPESCWEDIDAVVASPGVALTSTILRDAKRRGLTIIGDIELFAREITVPVIAITGTNGKSTVTTLVGALLTAAGYQVGVAGNIGLPVLDRLQKPADCWVLELSSFQLDTTFSLAPKVACLLNISEDHLDRYENYDAYIQSKQSIFTHSNHQVFNINDAATRPSVFSHACVGFGLDPSDSVSLWQYLDNETQTGFAGPDNAFIPLSSINLAGRHNIENVLAALSIASLMAIPVSTMCHALQTFVGLEHRCQLVRKINDVEWINDSKGTNVGATIAAIEGLGDLASKRLIVIAGGQGKGGEFNLLKPTVSRFVRVLIVLGEDAGLLEQALSGVVTLFTVDTLEQAVALAKQQAQPFDKVLFSPACASFDMFRDYSQRGHCFMQAVDNLSMEA